MVCLGRNQAARTGGMIVPGSQPRTVPPMRVKVVALAHLGRLDEARAELSRALAIDPKLTIAGFREVVHFAAPEVLELFVTGLRLAGLPEG